MEKKKIYLWVIFILTVSSVLFACSDPSAKEVPQNNSTSMAGLTASLSEQNKDISSVDNKLKVSIIDVGQADSILIQTPNHRNLLIDAGNNNDDDKIISYLREQHVQKLDAVVGTHPHEDHIGGLDAVIKSFGIRKIFMPKVLTTTKTFEDVLNEVKNKNMKVTSAKAGMFINLDPQLKVEILAPNSEKYRNLNNYSVVIKLTYRQTSFLFTGDAEKKSEEEMLSRDYQLDADVLKVGHHGSANATSNAFLRAVRPKYAVISVGKDNDYGHPACETINKLKKAGVKVYRTDEEGTIVFVSDGKKVTVNTEKE